MNFINLRLEIDQDFVWRLFLMLCAVSIIIIGCDTTFAAEFDPNDVIGQGLCRLVKNLSGGTARGIATIGIFVTGISCLTQKISLPVAFLISVGIIVIFFAPKLVGFITGNADDANCPTS